MSINKAVRKLCVSPKIHPVIPSLSTADSPAVQSSTIDLGDEELLVAAEDLESSIQQSRICLPAGWIPALPEVDQRWISKALFQWSRFDQPELNPTKGDKMWWYPPQPPQTPNGMPSLERHFGTPLLLWMPRKFWRVRLVCPHPDCIQSELTSAGLHQRIKQVVGVSSSYYIASEYLACKSCKRRVISWSSAIISQLDIGHRIQFPCIMTYRLGCDMTVVRLMRQRGLGNSSSQLQKQLEEQHAETWLCKQIQFLTDYRGLARAVSSGLISPIPLGDLPVMPVVPKHRWLMQIYAQDVLSRLEEVKASITSLFGQVIKMDSTKKIVRKLAGKAQSTAAWATNVGNEHGHVIASVLTASEGWGLAKMAEGLVRRYKDAGVSPPAILYVDRDCCDTFFQCYLIDGISRWNEDRTLAAEGRRGPHSYSGLLRHAANQLAEEVLGHKMVEYTVPRKYTGELLGIEYLYDQNNAVMEDYKVACATLEDKDITVAEEESCC
ncbi:uncharacterized protein LOC134083423 [Sardina pilchardus]|uniref:uncharacterized protein LOC134083423 n=1 Tax=Sardina pilchardus TaxID=27697 RepID=UPI002E130BD7